MVFEMMDFHAFLIENPSVAVTILEEVAQRLTPPRTGSPPTEWH